MRERESAKATAKLTKESAERADEARIESGVLRRRESLGTRDKAGYATVPALLVAAFFFVERCEHASGLTDYAIAVGIVVLGLLAAAVTYGFVMRQLEDAARRWLRGFPFTFDDESYLRELSTKHKTSQISVEVRFRAPIPEGQRATIRDALVGAVGAVSWAAFSDDVLTVRSPAFEGYVIVLNDGDNFHTNAPHHAWFKRFVNRGLLTIHGRYPIETVKIAIR